MPRNSDGRSDRRPGIVGGTEMDREIRGPLGDSDGDDLQRSGGGVGAVDAIGFGWSDGPAGQRMAGPPVDPSGLF